MTRDGFAFRIAGLTMALLLGIALPIAAASTMHLATYSLFAVREHEINSRLEARANLQSLVKRAEKIPNATETDKEFSSDFLSGSQDPIIIAELQNNLRKQALKLQIQLDSASPLPAKTKGTNAYIGVRVVLRGQISEIQQWLHEIETASPLLFVERASFRIDTWPIKSDNQLRDGAAALVAELDVYGAKLPTATAGSGQAATTDPGPDVPATVKKQVISPGPTGRRNERGRAS